MSTQQHLEREMAKMGQQRAKKRNARARENQRETQTVAGRRLLRDLPALLVAAIKEWKAAARERPGIRHRALEKMNLIEEEVLASLTLQVVLDALAMARPYTRTAMVIAGRVEDEDRMRRFKEANKLSWTRLVGKFGRLEYEQKRKWMYKAMAAWGLEQPGWEESEKASLGVVLLELCVKHCGIIRAITVRQGRKDELRIVPTDEALEWVESQNAAGELMRPMYLPFVERPLDWESPMIGGFHSTDVFATAVVKTANRGYLETLEAAKIPEVYGALNAIQGTGWKVNPLVWEMFSYMWESGYETVGLPSRDLLALPAKPDNLENDLAGRTEWKKAARAVHDTNNRRKGERFMASKLHWVCSRYLEQTFWFPYQMDWRGRTYPVSYYLHPQGPDLVRSLLQFAEGKPVVDPEAQRWHTIHGANCWGLDKLTFDERILWVTSNKAWLKAIANDPLVNRGWEDAKSPWQFLAWVFDWFALQSDPAHISCLPIHQDATQSGIQIYSLLLRDLEGAKATNCLASERPEDLYGRVAETLTQMLVDSPEAIAKEWLLFGIDRDCTKRPVMTRVYNATKHSARTYVQDWAIKKGREQSKKIPALEGGSSLWWLTERLWEAMSAVTTIEVTQDWLGAIAQIFSEQELAIHWTSPLGFPIQQWYPKWSTKTVKTLVAGIYRQTGLRQAERTLNPRRMRSAFAPNFIHSLDASAMFRAVNLAVTAGVDAFACIHDSYATVAADSQKLADATREAYVGLFETDLLSALRSELQAQLPRGVELPSVPQFGSLIVSELRHSPYFFS